MEHLDIRKITGRLYTDQRILSAEKEAEKVFRRLIISTVVLCVFTIVSLIVTLVTRYTTTSLVIFFSSIVAQFMLFFFGTWAMSKASKEILEALDIVYEENRQELAKYYMRLRKQEGESER